MASNGQGSNDAWNWQEMNTFENYNPIFPDTFVGDWNSMSALNPTYHALEEAQLDHNQRLLLNGVAHIEQPTTNNVPLFDPPTIPATTTNAAVKTTKNKVVKEKEKGKPWTEEEHKQFLMGLEKHGRGAWKCISREFIPTRTSIQVASHAQKHFKRQHNKRFKRWSIFDITTDGFAPTPDATMPNDTTGGGGEVGSSSYATPASPIGQPELLVNGVPWVPKKVQKGIDERRLPNNEPSFVTNEPSLEEIMSLLDDSDAGGAGGGGGGEGVSGGGEGGSGGGEGGSGSSNTVYTLPSPIEQPPFFMNETPWFMNDTPLINTEAQPMTNGPQLVINEAQLVNNGPQWAMNEAQPLTNGPQLSLYQAQLVTYNGPQWGINEAQSLSNGPQLVLNEAQVVTNGPQWAINEAQSLTNGPPLVFNEAQPVPNEPPQPVVLNSSEPPFVLDSNEPPFEFNYDIQPPPPPPPPQEPPLTLNEAALLNEDDPSDMMKMLLDYRWSPMPTPHSERWFIPDDYEAGFDDFHLW